MSALVTAGGAVLHRTNDGKFSEGLVESLENTRPISPILRLTLARKISRPRPLCILRRRPHRATTIGKIRLAIRRLHGGLRQERHFIRPPRRCAAFSQLMAHALPTVPDARRRQ
jgi:hypothetical protein